VAMLPVVAQKSGGAFVSMVGKVICSKVVWL
jgi:hypothetical protein